MAVAETGSFSKAARALHKVQSAVSYNIKSLEAQLDVTLFERSTRRVALTGEGRVLLEEARSITRGVTHLSALAHQFGRGVEPGVRVAIDFAFPSPVFAWIARAFRGRFPGVHLAVSAAMMGAVFQDLAADRIDLGVTGMPDLPAGVVGEVAGTCPMVAVVSPHHPLAEHRGPVPTAVLERHLQLVVADPSDVSEGATSTC